MIKNSPIGLTKELLSSVIKEQHENFHNYDLGIKREILDQLKNIILSPQVTVITGLRRVGKSTLLAQIAKTYLNDNFYYINFEDERLINFKAEEFDSMREVLISLFGEKKIFLLDEIQNAVGWERFVRRLHDQGYKFIITGSNASLLSAELGTKLTGRSIKIELFPFSFKEFLDFKKIKISSAKILTTKQKGQFVKLTNEYLSSGGIPDALKYPDLEIHKSLYDDVLYRDIAARYQIENIKSLKELAFYLVSNSSALISFNKLKDLLKLGSVNTVKSYVEYLENSWLIFVINKYAFSIKEQQIAAKKIYGIDTGLVRSVGFSFSENMGRLLENVVFLKLRKQEDDIYYYKTRQDFEVDFFLPKKNVFIQVCQYFDTKTKGRELRALLEAYKEQDKSSKLLVITQSEKLTLKIKGLSIEIIPLYEWLLK